MPIYLDPSEKEAILSIYTELRKRHNGIKKEHLTQLVQFEAMRFGIQPGISGPFIRSLIDEGG